MTLLTRLLKKRMIAAIATVSASVLFAAITLWWNMHLSSIINAISAGQPLSAEAILLAIAAMFALCIAGWQKTYLFGYTCEALTHDMRMGYARHFSTLAITEVEKLNAGEQLSKLQNEIVDVSRYLSDNLFQLIDHAVSFIATLGWLLMLNAKLTIVVNMA